MGDAKAFETKGVIKTVGQVVARTSTLRSRATAEDGPPRRDPLALSFRVVLGVSRSGQLESRGNSG